MPGVRHGVCPLPHSSCRDTEAVGLVLAENRNLVHAVTDFVFDTGAVQIGLLVANGTHGGRSIGRPIILIV